MADLTPVNNYLVPAVGGVSGYPIRQVFSAVPLEVDFRFIELDGESFTPSGVFIDNSQGTGDLVITIRGILGYSIVCPAGARLQTQYPAPMNQQVSITGQGQADITFVNFPVIPFQQEGAVTLGAVTIADGGDVAEGATTDPPAAAPFTDPYTAISLLKYLASQTVVDSGALTDIEANTNGAWTELLLQTPDIDAIRVSNAALLTIETSPAASTFASVALTGASQVILASNANRKGCVIVNDSVNILKLLCNASAASGTNFTAQLNPGDSFSLSPGEYTGEIRGISSVASGNARVTEFS